MHEISENAFAFGRSGDVQSKSKFDSSKFAFAKAALLDLSAPGLRETVLQTQHNGQDHRQRQHKTVYR